MAFRTSSATFRGWTAAFLVGLGSVGLASACATGEEPPGEDGGSSSGGNPPIGGASGGRPAGGAVFGGAPNLAGMPSFAGTSSGGRGGGSGGEATSGTGGASGGLGGASGSAGTGGGKGGSAGTAGATGGSGGSGGAVSVGPIANCTWTSPACMSKTCEAVCMNLEGGHCARTCNAIITCAKSMGCSTAADPLCVKRSTTTGKGSACTEYWDMAGGDVGKGSTAAFGFYSCACAGDPGTAGSGGMPAGGTGGAGAGTAGASAGSGGV